MAYANWVTPSKVSGSGDDTVSWTGQPHTGRVSRSTTAKFSASGCENRVLTINQAGKAEFVTIDSTASVNKTGGTVTISGTSNSKKLTFSLANNNIGLSLPDSYTANGASAASGSDITGDPGATAQYAFSITFTGIDENENISALSSQLTVTASGGQTATCTIQQAAGDPYLTIEPSTIELTAEGTAVSVSVSSNTSWTIS